MLRVNLSSVAARLIKPSAINRSYQTAHKLIPTSEIANLYQNVAPFYKHRPRYDPLFVGDVLRLAFPQKYLDDLVIADIGSGNGASRQALVQAGCHPDQLCEIEPSAEIRALSCASEGRNVIEGTAVYTNLPSKSCDGVTFFNSVHQAVKNNSKEEISAELARILKPEGQIIFVIQRFDPQNPTIQALHAACEQWKLEGLYPAYGDNGIQFILNNASGTENAKQIMHGLPETFMQDGYQEITGSHDVYYNQEEFLGLLRSYLSFPFKPSPQLLSAIDDFFNQYVVEKSEKLENKIAIPCTQVAVVGRSKQ